MSVHRTPSARLIGVIREMYGLDMSGHRIPALFDCLSAIDRDIERAADVMLRSPARLNELVECATNNETYFFRHAEQLTALQELVANSLIRHPRASLRVWVAGCSSGEEALSIAAVLRGALMNAPGTSLSVLGTDLHRGMLQKASSGYTMWSFRGVPPELRAAHFVERNGRYEPSEALRALVRYRRHNLLEGPPEAMQFDVVSCRNVLIYFDGAMVRRAIELLTLAVAPGGFLLLGPAESPAALLPEFETILQGGATVFRRKAGLTLAPPPEERAPRSARARRVPPRRARRRSSGSVRAVAQPRKATASSALHAAPDSAEARVAAALASLEQGDSDAALKHLHGVIVADVDNAMAHYLIGSILESRGAKEDAEQYYRQALMALAGRDPTLPLACGGGITVEELVSVLADILHVHRTGTPK